MNRTFEKVILTFASILVIGSCIGLFLSATLQTKSSNTTHREMVGTLENIQNNVKRKGFGTFAWDVMSSHEPAFFKDVIFVSPKSSMTIRLNDNTELQIGENTLLVLDNKLTESGERMDVTELRLIRGDINVKKPSDGAQGSQARGLQIVLNDNVKLDLNTNTNASFSKHNDKASILVNQGNLDFNVASNGRKLAFAKPTLLQDIDLKNDSTILENLKLEDATSQAIPLSTTDHSAVSARGELDSAIPHKIFSNLKQKNVSEVQNDKSFELDRSLAAIPEPEPVPTPVASPLPVITLPEPSPSPTPEPLKVRLPIQQTEPSDNHLVDVSHDIRPITFAWDSTIVRAQFYMLELSSDKQFTKVLTRIAIDGAEGRPGKDEFGKKTEFSLKVSPIYMLYVPGLLGSVYKSKEIYWRVVPLDRDNNPLLRSSKLSSRRIAFKTSRSAELTMNESNDYTRENIFTSDPKINLQWTLKNVVPGSYQVIISESSDFATPLCTRDIPKFSFKKGMSLKEQPDMSKQTSSFGLVFYETLSLDIRNDCPLEESMKAGKTFYYKIITLDPAEQKVPYSTNGSSNVGKFNFKK